MNEQAIWELAAEGGMAALTVERLAQKTGGNPLELARLYPEPAFMVVAVMERIHAQAMELSSAASASVQDRLTDRVMAHLDASLPHRDAVRRLWGDLTGMPLTLLTLRPYLLKMGSRILKEGGAGKEDFWAPVRLRAYVTLFLYVLYTWVYDESPDQEQTLVTLDKGLKQLGALPW